MILLIPELGSGFCHSWLEGNAPTLPMIVTRRAESAAVIRGNILSVAGHLMKVANTRQLKVHEVTKCRRHAKKAGCCGRLNCYGNRRNGTIVQTPTSTKEKSVGTGVRKHTFRKSCLPRIACNAQLLRCIQRSDYTSLGWSLYILIWNTVYIKDGFNCTDLHHTQVGSNRK